MERAGARGSGDDVGRGEDGAEGRRDGQIGGDLVQNASELGGIAEVEAVKFVG